MATTRIVRFVSVGTDDLCRAKSRKKGYDLLENQQNKV